MIEVGAMTEYWEGKAILELVEVRKARWIYRGNVLQAALLTLLS